jgi:hypothetical protein
MGLMAPTPPALRSATQVEWLGCWALLLWVFLWALIYTPASRYIPFDWFWLSLYGVLSLALLFAQIKRSEQVASVLFHFQWMLTLFPLTFLIVFGTLLSYTLARLGRIPFPHQPGPEVIGINLVFLYHGWMLLFASVLIASLLLQGLITRSIGSSLGRKTCWLISMVAWGAFFVVVECDPLRFLDWLGG